MFRTLRKFVKDIASIPVDLVALPLGAAVYRTTSKTPPSAFVGMWRLNCRTRGYSNALLHRLVQAQRPPCALPEAHGVLGDLSAGDVARIAADLNENGYHVFPVRLPPDLCRRLLDFAQTTESTPYPARPGRPKLAAYDRDNPAAETYHFFDEQVLLDNPDIQALVSDPSLLAVAQAYLGVPPILENLTLWWSTALSPVANSESAQLYHMDLVRPKFLKFFFYLTDVTARSGPHCYVAQSHKPNGRPRRLLKYAEHRIPENELERYYPEDRIVEITGPQGTIFAADTLGYHKGKKPESGDRLVLQLQFSDCLFGAEYRKVHIRRDHHPRLRDLAARFGRIYSKYILD